MAITIMRKSKAISHYSISKFSAFPLVFILSGNFAVAADIEYSASVNAELSNQEIERPASEDLSLQTFSVSPTISAFYNSKKLGASLSAQHNYLKRDNEAVATENNFTSYSANVRYSPIERLLTLQASSNINYRPVNVGNFIVTDFLTNSDELSKTQNNSVGLIFNASQGDLIRSTFNANYSDIKTDRTNAGNAGINAENLSSSLSLRNGDEVRWVRWQLNGQYQETRRDTGQYGNFTSLTASGNSDLMLASWFGIRFTASTETQETSAPNSAFAIERKFNSYGAGITLTQSPVRTLSITYNKTDSNISSSDDEDFIGGDLIWAFSNRTSVSAQYGRRFYGESGSADITYNTKYLRSSLRYNESATNTTRLLATVDSLGVFVCPIDSQSIIDCRQPDSLDYEPQAGEVLTQFSQNIFDLNDNIIIRKALNGIVGYSFSKISYSLSLTRSEDETVETERSRIINSADLTANYTLSSKTNFNASIRYARTKEQLLNVDDITTEQRSTTRTFTLRINHSLSNNLNTYGSISNLDRSGQSFNAGIFGNDYTETRLSIGITYTYP